MATKTKSVKRTRLSPEVRRDQILDSAKQSILKDGLQQLSLKKLAIEADVSEPLLFHYFSSRVELLQQLLAREYQRQIITTKQLLDQAETLDEILVVHVTKNYDDVDQNRVMDILLAETEIAKAIEKTRREAIRESELFLIDKISTALNVSRKKAAMLALMGSAASKSVAEFAHQTKVGRKTAINTVVEFIRAGFEAQANR